MLPAYTYESICSDLSEAFKHRYDAPSGESVRLVGLLFARPGSQLTKAEILPHLNHYHHRSGNHVDFFCGGYGPTLESFWDEDPNELVKVEDFRGHDWYFSDRKFNLFRQEIQSRTRWKYSGGVDLLLANARFDPALGQAALDFGAALAVDLYRAREDKAIPSIEQFFEQIFQYAESQTGSTPTFNLSDALGRKIAGSAVKNLIVRVVPEPLRDGVRQAFHFYVRDIRPAGNLPREP